MQFVIDIENGVPRHPQYRMKEPVNFTMLKGEHIALVGPNGGGKSLLVDILTGRWPLLMNEVKYDFAPSASALVCDNIKYITFRDSYGDAEGGYYYQQRWNSQDKEVTPLVKDLLPVAKDEAMKETLYQLFGMDDLLDKHIVLLSSGELRRFQLVKSLLGNPKILILDNPFIGLDAATRDLLRGLLQRLVDETHLQVMLLLSRVEEIPDFISHVVLVKDCICGKKVPLAEFLQGFEACQDEASTIVTPSCSSNQEGAEEVVRLNKVTIRYDDRIILKELDWVVHRGEKWALTGQNGSGKSTLLSLVCADNPQSYACDIALFGRKRGTGESIWEIKKRIGYVSPEIHRAYLKNMPAIDIVASGLHDSVGLYVRPKPEQKGIC